MSRHKLTSEARRSYTVVFELNSEDLIQFLERLRKALLKTYPCSNVEDWKGVGATMKMTVSASSIEVIACSVNDFAFGSIMLNIAEPYGFLRLLRSRDFKSVRSAALRVSDDLIRCGIASENQYWARSNPPDFDNVEDWKVGVFSN